MNELTVAVDGLKESYHHMAARDWVGGNKPVNWVFCNHYREVAKHLKSQPEALGFLAVESSVVGWMQWNIEWLDDDGFSICGEHTLEARFCLGVLPGQKIEDIKLVRSHPLALRHAEPVLRENAHWLVEEVQDTAWSAHEIKFHQLRNVAAIVSPEAAAAYGLDIVLEDVQGPKPVRLRFHVIRSKPWAYEPNHNKICMLIKVGTEVGSLYQLSRVLACAWVNVKTFHTFSRPEDGVQMLYLEAELPKKPEFNFLDFLKELRENSLEIAVLGSYLHPPV